MPGLFAGLLGCLFGVVGIFALGLVFVPLAALCTAVGLIRALAGRSMAGFGTSLIAGVVTAIAFVTSPSLLLLLGGVAVAMSLPGSDAPAGMLRAHGPQRSPVLSGDIQFPGPRLIPGRQPGNGSRTEGANPMSTARAEAEAGTIWCRNRRLSGELASYAASADCANPLVILAYSRAGYRHMDLVTALTARRRELAGDVDDGRLTEVQANARLARFAADLASVERQRDDQR